MLCIATLPLAAAMLWCPRASQFLAGILTIPGLQVTLSLAATLVAFSSVVLGKKLNLAYSAKLYGIAFIIVTFGAVDEETTGTSVFLLASMVGSLK